MPVSAIKAAKRRQALGIIAFLAGLTVAVSVVYHVVRADAVAYHHGEKAYARGDHAVAVSYFEKARAAGMRTSVLQWHHASSLIALGRRAEALPLLREILARDPADRAALAAATGLAQSMGDPALGLELYAGLGPRENLPAADLARMADLYQQAGRLDEAVACLRLALVAAPSADLHVWLGQLHARAQDKSAAREAFAAALALEPGHRAARLAHARALAWEGDFAASASAYRAYLGEN